MEEGYEVMFEIMDHTQRQDINSIFNESVSQSQEIELSSPDDYEEAS